MIWYNIEETKPEDVLKHRKYKLWGQNRMATEYVLCIAKTSEVPFTAQRVCIQEQGIWAWSMGNGIASDIIYWTEIENPPFDWEAIKQYKKEIKNWLNNKKTNK